MTEVDIKLKDKKSHNTTTSCIVGISEVSGKYARSQTRSPGKLNKGRQSAFDPKHPWSGNYFDLEAAKFVKPIGIEHFFDAFSLEKKRPLKVDAASALNIPVNEVSDLLVVIFF